MEKEILHIEGGKPIPCGLTYFQVLFDMFLFIRQVTPDRPIEVAEVIEVEREIGGDIVL